MKVLFINHFPLTGSGSGVYTANLAKSLERKNNDVAIIFPENREKYEEYEGIKLYPVFFKGNNGLPNKNSVDMNFPCFTTHPRSTFNFMDMTGEQKRKYEEVFYNKITNVIKEFKPDVVHVQHIWTLAGIASKCCERNNNIPLIITCHGTDLMGIQNEKEKSEKWGTNWAKSAVNYANKIVTISKDSNKLLKETMHEADNKTIWIRNGVDSHVFYPNDKVEKSEVLKELGINKEYNNVVSFAGKLTSFKGVDVLLNAAKKYENDKTLTIIAGDGELRSDLEKQADKLDLKNIKFVGNQPQTMLNKIYNIADCSCVPSRREPFGLVAAEAMLCGTPVIATNEGGLPDFVTKDVGVLVQSENSDELYDAVKGILNKKIKFDSNHIADKIKENYSQDSLINEFVDVYEESIKENKKIKEQDDFER